MTENGNNYLSYDRGILSWLFTLDHKRVGVTYLVSIAGAFLLGGLLALLVQTEMIGPGRTVMSAEAFSRAFTLHGVIMVFLVLVPSIPAALGSFLLPVMLGVDRLALPRLNLFTFHLWLFGVLLVVMSAFAGGVDTGWTFSVPYALSDGRLGVSWMAVGVVVLCVATMVTALNFMVTIHRLRPGGMTWFRMPLFIWSMYCTAVVHLIAAPILAAAFALLLAERTWHRGLIDPTLGGDPLLFSRLFWFALHPLIWVLMLPAMGIVSEVISVHSRRAVFGYRWIAFSGVAIAVFSFLGGGQHLIAGGQPPVFSAAASGLTLAMFIPVSIIMFNWLATLNRGSIGLDTPVLYAVAFIINFAIGTLAGLFLAAPATALPLLGTQFAVAQFHYLFMGGVVAALLGGLHHWWPKITGRMYNETYGRIGAAVIFVGFNITFFPLFVLGFGGVPQRLWDYEAAAGASPAMVTSLHLISSIGTYLLAAGVVVIMGYLIHSMARGPRAAANPWGGRGLEWRCPSPPPVFNFRAPPEVGDIYNYSDPREDQAGSGTAAGTSAAGISQ